MSSAQTSQIAVIWTYCSPERDFCAFSGTRLVRYGADGAYVTAEFTDGIQCDNTSFVDPIRFIAKECYVQELDFVDSSESSFSSSSTAASSTVELIETSLDQQFSTASVDGAIELIFNSDIAAVDFDVELTSLDGDIVPLDVEMIGPIMTIQAQQFLNNNAEYRLTVTGLQNVDSLTVSAQLSQKVTVTAMGTIEISFLTQKASFEGYLPSDKKPRETLLKSKKLVFAHYFTPFPQMINNKLPGEDYYDSQYLNPDGENAKFRSKGGFLRERPLYRAPFNESSDWKMTDARFQVRQAASIGIDGFSMNILEIYGSHWERILRMYDAAEEIDGFKILIMPDMNAVFKSNPEQFIPTIQKLASRSASYRLDDGRLVVSPYLAENQSPSWWKSTLDELKAKGIKVALVPLYQGWVADFTEFKQQEPAAFSEYVVGVSDWGSRTPSGGYNLKAAPAIAHSDGVLWMAPVAPQDSRPKSEIYTETGNSEAFRAMWMSAIDGGADWVQIITWNDYSETSEIAPSSEIGYSFYDLAAYYIDWFKSGSQPRINRDAIYAFYREHSTDAVLGNGSIQENYVKCVNGEAPRNEIEMLAFLASPATLEIEIEDNLYTKNVDKSGIVSFKVPLQEGTPKFRILRNNLVVSELTDTWPIDNSITVQDMTYRGMTGNRQAIAGNTQYLGWPQKLDVLGTSKMVTAKSDSPYARKSNAMTTEFIFSGNQASDGFSYHFLPQLDAKTTTVSFDINLTDACLLHSTLLVKLLGQGTSGVTLALCNSDNALLGISNRTPSGKEALEGSALRPNSWYQIEITAKQGNNLYQFYDLVLTRADQSRVEYKSLAFENNLDQLSEIRFLLEDSQASEVKVLVDNISVD